MLKLCSLAGIPVPHFEEYQSGFLVEFRKNIYTEEYLRKLGLNERQIKAVMYVKEKGTINNSKYQDINDIGKTPATEDLQKLVEIGLLTEPTAKGRGAKYELKN
jgi:ATP-dependent DNA helicase RecG